MTKSDRPSFWQRWVKHPQTTFFRRAVFQIHLWSGIGLGLYVFMISVTGSVLVYRNELSFAATPAPIVSKGAGPRLSDDELAAAALRVYPGYRIGRMQRSRNLDEAVGVWLLGGDEINARLFDPRTGADVGAWTPLGIKMIEKLAALHDDLFAGELGRKVNGIGAVAVLVMALTGLTIWWPGIDKWRRSLIVRRGVGWKRFIWDLHGMVGFWSFLFVVVFGASGIYLCFPESLQAFADWLEPLTDENAGHRFVDDALYWLAYLHFGRINGIGIPCHAQPGICDQTTKAVWALFGLAPAATFATGAIMWWNRVLRPWLKAARVMERRAPGT